MESHFGPKADIVFMKKALKQAHVAYRKKEVPIGAVIVAPDHTVIARSHNKIESLHTQSGHAEMLAMIQAGRKRGDWRLEGHWLYVTMEPCAMCMHMMFLSRLEGVVFGAPSPLFGYQLDKINRFEVYKKDAVRIVEGICALESINLLRTFFKEIRRGKKWSKQKKEQWSELI